MKPSPYSCFAFLCLFLARCSSGPTSQPAAPPTPPKPYVTVSLPPPVPVSAETNAINIVKHAILTVPGKGRSATDIEENLNLFMTPGTGVTAAKGWSATAAGPNLYNASFDFNDGGNGERQAIWSVNIVTKQVKYVNEAAKTFSWTPNY